MPKVSYQTTLDHYLIGCFAFLVFVMLSNVLVIVGSESLAACGLAAERAHGWMDGAHVGWKAVLASALEAWVREPRGVPGRGALAG